MKLLGIISVDFSVKHLLTFRYSTIVRQWEKNSRMAHLGEKYYTMFSLNLVYPWS